MFPIHFIQIYILNVLLQGIGCSYHTGASKYGNTHYSLQAHQLPVVYDIEDIIKVGKRNTLCPYFSLRHLLQQSDIIFCPYNYLIDPIIRESVSIDKSSAGSLQFVVYTGYSKKYRLPTLL